MTERPRADELQDVLDAYRAALDEPSKAALDDWIRRYPQYARELTDFTVGWSLSQTLPPRPEVLALPSEALRRLGLDALARVFGELAMTSLSDAGTARGLTVDQVAQRAGLSLVLLRMLDRRLIRYSSIPRQAIEAVASAIGRDAAAVASYLQGAPTLAPGASYYAEQKPELAEQDDFFDAVRDDPDLDEATRTRWLDLAPPGQ